MPTTFSDPDLAADRLARALADGGFEVGEPTPSTRVLLDTFDGRLHRAGLQLELRQGATSQLVLSGGDHTVPAVLAIDRPPAFADALPPGPFRARVLPHTEERALLPVVSVRSVARSVERRDRRGKVVAQLTIHSSIESEATNGAVLPEWVAEVVGVAGHGDDLEQTLQRLHAMGLEPSGSDLCAVVASAVGIDLAGHESSPTVPLDGDEDALDGFRRVLANLADTIDANLEGTVAATDPEFLHELRVAVRRTRSVLAQSRGVLPSDVRERFRESFGWLGSVTGRARDLDVYVLGWDDLVAPIGADDPGALDKVRDELQARRLAAHRALANALRSDTCHDLLSAWRQWLEGAVGEPSGRPLGPLVAQRTARAQERLLAHGRAITADSPAEDLHDLRKDAKKLRYLLECFGSLHPTKARKAFVGQLKALQDNLGDHQDAEVHLEHLRELARDLHDRSRVDTDTLLAMGRITDHLERRRQAERDDFMERFQTYDTKANRRALEALLAQAAAG
ncbi:MAG: CHAD domain-containing protein [Acidimicrobiales bacterium]